tara:strand:+ start:245 stop:772 length:528 start_codon:yes stop_codon:yes gene_type:complete
VLVVEAQPIAPGHTDAFDIRCFASLATVLCCGGSEHVLFSDGLRHLQLMVTAGSVLDGPVCFRYLLSGLRHTEAKVPALQRLCGLCRLGRLPRGLFPPERRAKRWAMMLRAWDGEIAGASRRQVAAAIFGETAAHELWESGYRSRMQRLVREAEEMISGGYLRLLGRAAEGKGGF